MDPATHTDYPKGFLMRRFADPPNTRFDSAQVNNISTNGTFNWRTRIASFKLGACQ